MRASMWVAAVAAAVACAGCMHANTTHDVPTETDEAKATPVTKQADPAHPPRDATPLPGTTGTSAKPEAERSAAAPGRPQLASSPEGMMLPEGPTLIQQALTRLGFLTDHVTGTLDDETSGALRRFQVHQKLARTGAPDRETLHELGLSSDRIFRKPGS